MTTDQVAIVTLLISIVGALAWLPQIVSVLKRQRLFGKIISKYNNYNDSKTLFLFKLSILCTNKDFQLREIACTIQLENGKRYESKALNMRKVVFNRNEELQILGRDFINNYSVLTHDTNVEGYLYFEFDVVDPSMKIARTEFEFKSFNNRAKKIAFDERKIDGRQLFYDDSIWKKN